MYFLENEKKNPKHNEESKQFELVVGDSIAAKLYTQHVFFLSPKELIVCFSDG